MVFVDGRSNGLVIGLRFKYIGSDHGTHINGNSIPIKLSIGRVSGPALLYS